MILFQKSFSQKLTASILVICLVGSITGSVLLLPNKAQAQCTVYVAADATEVTHIGLQTAWESLKEVWRSAVLSENIIQTATLLWDKAQQLIKWALGVLLNTLLHQILAQLTNDIVNWIQNGDEPRFMTEGLGDYLWRAVDATGGDFVDRYLGGDWLCESFDLDIKTALLDVPTFEEEVKCSLSDIGVNFNEFSDDFSAGGWKGWVGLTKPNNNFYGAFLITQAEKMNKEAEAEEEVRTDAEMGEGFLSMKDCKWYDRRGILVAEQQDVRGIPPLPDICRPANSTNTPCIHKCQTLTPASSVNRMANKASTNFFDQINAQISAATVKAGPFQVYVQAIINALINRVITEGIGLLKADNVPSPAYGNIGRSADIREITTPEDVILAETDAELTISYLISLKGELQDLLSEQQTNLALLNSLIPTYQGFIPVLNNVISACSGTPFGGYTTWAQDQINNINNNLIPSFNAQISQLEDDIAETILLIDDTDTTILLVQDFILAADNWLLIWEAVEGDPDAPELIAATNELNAAQALAITGIQVIVEEINGIAYSSSFTNLNGEIVNAVTNIVYTSLDLSNERGDPAWPLTGTLYGYLDAAADIQTTANEYIIACNNWGW